MYLMELESPVKQITNEGGEGCVPYSPPEVLVCERTVVGGGSMFSIDFSEERGGLVF